MRASFFDLEDRTDQLRADLSEDPARFARFLDRLELSIIYHDFALDGLVIGYDEIKASVDKNIISDASLIPRYREIANFKEVLGMVRREAETGAGVLSLDFVRAVHKALYKDVAGASPGRYRKDEEIEGGYYHTVLEASRISYETRRLLAEAESDGARLLHPVSLASSLHYQMLHVAPFGQGSGRMARLLANFVLIREGFLPVVIHSSERQRYFELLCSNDGDLTPLYVDAIDNTIGHGVKFLQADRETRRNASAGAS